ncbi:MAG: hypothetical protein KME28_20460 [Pelatocladus maniniholoensis HA4357-MV3]|jgi:hypothetical protein|uniref:Uncharacterized protein n=1 Tax=Pelatocladus maniniholoensis HA4357-MV3 TaxID=1117104 RepID=A0A9E3HC51_9NOST|nr:hypothetical protein [Pelatocladus maniniholoensis HA4357-MV3]BAZ66226.1 hypothetical protein NIES4106_09730 [Fischerella sp. NIES-4106]
MLKLWQALFTPHYFRGVGLILVLGIFCLSLDQNQSIYANLLSTSPAYAQNVRSGDVWQQVYEQLPDLPKENQYISKETGKVAENNTLVSRLIQYHVYLKGRAPNYRLDWKLTLADYLNANEVMYDSSYPGHDTLKKNPFQSDRAAIRRLTRKQRNALVQALVNAYSQN